PVVLAQHVKVLRLAGGVRLSCTGMDRKDGRDGIWITEHEGCIAETATAVQDEARAGCAACVEPLRAGKERRLQLAEGVGGVLDARGEDGANRCDVRERLHDVVEPMPRYALPANLTFGHVSLPPRNASGPGTSGIALPLLL